MFFFKLKTFLRRNINGLLKTHRPTSYPYITSDSFRVLANHVYDDTLDFNPDNVQKNDVVFVRSFFLKDFFEHYLD